MLSHSVCSMLQLTGYLSHLIMGVGMMFEIHLTTMIELNSNQFHCDNLKGKKNNSFHGESWNA